MTDSARVRAVLGALADAAADRGLHAGLAWKRVEPSRRRLVGLFPVWAPAALIEALGMRAVLLGATADGPEPSAADGRLQSFVCALTRDVYQAALDGGYGELDAIVVPSVCDVARNLASLLARAMAPRPVFYLHVPQAGPVATARRYLGQELARLGADLAAVAGSALDASALTRALSDQDRRARAVVALRSLRANHPGRLPAADWLVALRGAWALPAAEAAHRLEDLAAALGAGPGPAPRRDRIRVRLHGCSCEPPPARILAAIEDSGAEVVADDLLAGLDYLGASSDVDPVPADRAADGAGAGPGPRTVAELVGGLAARVLGGARPIATRHDPGRDAVRDVVDGSAAYDGVIVATPRFCEPVSADAVRIRRHLRQKAVPVADLEFDQRMAALDGARARVEALAESLLFAPPPDGAERGASP